MNNNINLYLGDCMEAMKGMKDNQYDLAIVDPPYGIDIANMDMGLGKNKKASKSYNRKYKNSDWDKVIPDKDYFIQLKRVSKNQIICGGNYFDVGPCKHFVIWDKGIPEGLSFSDCEFLWTSFIKAQRIYKLSVYLEKESGKFHPTKKPIKLYKWLLKNYAQPGDKILDTHGGSMSIAIACHDMKFDLDLWELDEDYFKAGKKRFDNHIRQLQMF